jgi:pantoate--beta-alanine ligase
MFLKADERERALALSRGLRAAQRSSAPVEAEAAMMEELRQQELEVDYAVVRHAATLESIDSFDPPARALIAARVGSVRLIDNAAVGRPAD